MSKTSAAGGGRRQKRGLTGPVELFCGNGAAEWALCHVVMLMRGGGCGDPPFTLDTGLGLKVQGVGLANGAHMFRTEGLVERVLH